MVLFQFFKKNGIRCLDRWPGFRLKYTQKRKKQPAMIKKTDFLVIGSGIAGLSYALKAAKIGKVTIITKKQIQQTNTALAQGGVAAVFSKIDSFDLHIKDTLNAGDGLCNEEVAAMVVKNGPSMIFHWEKKGVMLPKELFMPMI